MGHIELARWADDILIIPASANIIAKLAHGIADDLLSTLCLASPTPLTLAPAMNQQMWHHPATQANLKTLEERGAIIIPPADGEQACGDVGLGRLADLDVIMRYFTNTPKHLADQHVVITAGPTQEAIDPVRYLSNHSSGKMGYALARAACEAGATVTLISGPTSLTAPRGVTTHRVTSATDMMGAVDRVINDADIFIASAAVADYSPLRTSLKKIKKTSDELTLTLSKNPDILAHVASLPKKPYCVGFAAETDNDILHLAKDKWSRKKLDLIVANRVGHAECPFGEDENHVVVWDGESCRELPKQSKINLARELISIIAKGVKHEPSRTQNLESTVRE